MITIGFFIHNDFISELVKKFFITLERFATAKNSMDYVLV